jgi:hypothetical protein
MSYKKMKQLTLLPIRWATLLSSTEEHNDVLELLPTTEEPGTMAPDVWDILTFEATGLAACRTSYQWPRN